MSYYVDERLSVINAFFSLGLLSSVLLRPSAFVHNSSQFSGSFFSFFLFMFEFLSQSCILHAESDNQAHTIFHRVLPVVLAMTYTRQLDLQAWREKYGGIIHLPGFLDSLVWLDSLSFFSRFAFLTWFSFFFFRWHFAAHRNHVHYSYHFAATRLYISGFALMGKIFLTSCNRFFFSDIKTSIWMAI